MFDILRGLVTQSRQQTLTHPERNITIPPVQDPWKGDSEIARMDAANQTYKNFQEGPGARGATTEALPEVNQKPILNFGDGVENPEQLVPSMPAQPGEDIPIFEEKPGMSPLGQELFDMLNPYKKPRTIGQGFGDGIDKRHNAILRNLNKEGRYSKEKRDSIAWAVAKHGTKHDE